MTTLKSFPATELPVRPPVQRIHTSPIIKEEDEEDYYYGGYHPVSINEKFGANKNYKVIRKLGWGHFSTVWLAFDSITLKHVALKIVRSDHNYTEAAIDEINILTKISKTNPQHPGYHHIVKLLDWFYHKGPNGKHVVMVLELLGESLLGLLNKFNKNTGSMNFNDFSQTFGGLPIPIVQKITKQLCLAFDYLHRECGLIHTDIKPENVLIEIKDVEKFLRCLDAHGETHQDDHPIKCSKPLSSPIMKKSISVDYIMSKFKDTKDTLSSQSLINYYENNYTTQPTIMTNLSVSPLSRPLHLHHQVSVCASEADLSDDEENYSEVFDFYKTHTNTTTPPPSTSSRRSTFDHDMLNHEEGKEEQEAEQEGALTEDELYSLINVKLADLGNSCYVNHHFTNDIQTRQYRSPEIILGSEWGCSTDCWSLGCLIFELITGDFLFDPKKGKSYSKNDDHIAQMLELLRGTDEDPGDVEEEKEFLKNSKYATKYFKNDHRNLKRIKDLRYWNLRDVLIEKYKMDKSTALEVSGFSANLLKLNPKNRANTGYLLKHDWLTLVKLETLALEDEQMIIDQCHGHAIDGWSGISKC